VAGTAQLARARLGAFGQARGDPSEIRAALLARGGCSVPHSEESAMMAMLFDVLFILALVAPPLAVCLGLVVLLLPARLDRPAAVRRDLPAHA
jgi:hypothetical protein